MNDAEKDTPRNTENQTPEIRLRCLGGNPAPPTLVDGWRRFLGLPEQAKSDFWTLLQPVLMEPRHPANRERVESFRRNHSLAEEDLLPALRSCEIILRRAGTLDLDGAAFQQDLATLSEGDTQGAQAIIAQYDAAKVGLRKQMIQESLADHGKVLVGLDWRVDNVSASDRGAQLNTTVIFLTLRCRDGDRTERITLQLTPEAVRELKIFCDRFAR